MIKEFYELNKDNVDKYYKDSNLYITSFFNIRYNSLFKKTTDKFGSNLYRCEFVFNSDCINNNLKYKEKDGIKYLTIKSSYPIKIHNYSTNDILLNSCELKEDDIYFAFLIQLEKNNNIVNDVKAIIKL